MAGALKLVGQEPVTELRVVAVSVDQRVGQVGVVELALADGRGEPGVMSPPVVAEHPADQPHGDAIGGQVTDQRVVHLGSDPAAKSAATRRRISLSISNQRFSRRSWTSSFCAMVV